MYAVYTGSFNGPGIHITNLGLSVEYTIPTSSNYIVSNINCPHLLNILKYLSSTMLIVSGYNLSLCPSPLGDQAFGTCRLDLSAALSNILTRIVSMVGQSPFGGVIKI